MNTIRISVKVQPKARKAGVEELGPDTFRIRVHAAPEKGAANREVIDRIAAHFKVPVSCVQIISGAKSRNKVIAVERRGRKGTPHGNI